MFMVSRNTSPRYEDEARRSAGSEDCGRLCAVIGHGRLHGRQRLAEPFDREILAITLGGVADSLGHVGRRSVDDKILSAVTRPEQQRERCHEGGAQLTSFHALLSAVRFRFDDA